MKELYCSFLDAQREIKGVCKDASNDFAKYKYSTISAVLDTVKGVLNKHGLIITQPIICEDGRCELLTKIIHAGSGNEMISSMPLELPENIFAKDGKNTAGIQSFGSEITYLRRYALTSMLALGTDDDDGVAAQTKEEKTVPKKRSSFKPKTQEIF